MPSQSRMYKPGQRCCAAIDQISQQLNEPLVLQNSIVSESVETLNASFFELQNLAENQNNIAESLVLKTSIKMMRTTSLKFYRKPKLSFVSLSIHSSLYQRKVSLLYTAFTICQIN